MKLTLLAGTVAGVLALAAPAVAAPVTVDLRIEDATRTLFEGPVTTDTAPFVAADGPHACGTVPTRGAALSTAAQAGLFAMQATWNAQFNSPTIDAIAGESLAYDPGTGRFLAEYKNGAFASVGACDDAVAAGDRVLFAYTDGNEPLLALSGPATAKPGEAVTLRVTDAGGAAVAGAAVGDRVSGADGTVTAGPWSDRGNHDLKASKAGTVRSNRVRVCVTDGADGACGTSVPVTPPPGEPDRAAPTATLSGFKDHQAFTRGPRELKGAFTDASGIKQVKLRLTKRAGKRCWYFSGRQERFRGTRCGKGAYFAIGDKADWSYLLPARLTKGRYVLDAIAIDGAGNRTPLARGTTRVVFTVR
ncbi:MAG TPA: hypothetical protein VNS09_16330 [Solirubrobacter sp.]|nr:hypothetical protein [Solirubrobacter sp.]